MTSPSLPKRGRLALLGAAIALAGILVAPPAHAADGSLAVDSPSIAIDETVTFTFDAGTAVHDRNWIGIYRDGVVPGGPASLDWRYVPTAAGEVTWNPSTREGWTRNSSTMGAGEYDVYLLEDDGYNVLAGPIDLTVTDDDAEPPVTPAEPKPEIEGKSGLNVLTFNVWHGGTQVADGARQIADIITQTDADVTFLPEVGQAPAQVAALLGYQHLTATDTGIVSRYPILSTDTVGRWWSKAVLDVNGSEVVVYGGHLEYRWYTTYLPRGYGGEVLGDWPTGWNTWSKLGAPVTDVEAILKANEQSGRPAAAADLVADIDAERAAGRLAIVGGDFNEPPSQDWTAATAGLFDHNGVVVPWQTTQRLLDGGLVDAFRTVHPDPVANPGFTWPSDNPLFPTSSLTWAPEADERDRIDYIFATPDRRLSIDGAAVVGPQSTIVRNARVVDDSADEIFTPDAVWPSDHKAVLANFTVCDEGCAKPEPEPEPEQPNVQLGAASVAAGSDVTISGTDFPATTALRIELRSTPMPLGTATTDASGAFRATVTVPADASPGAHSIVVIDPDGAETTVALTVTASIGGESPGGTPGGAPGTGGAAAPGSGGGTVKSDSLATTGADSMPLLLGGALLLGVGLGLVVWRRRRRHG
ncbi:endonuclease/exonuclease/phosphatase family protein [Microbacterium sp.]|uniref:endonuclease/exonuclease/phosphatase family protein n=1 Tax=Microbacterium sp. TaxID=51671 RepID=UPI0026306BA2|nr:endonuclease/exonuclease/phosphatase family protein [Microbacterium sp.]MCV0376983.1 endonuclease/exonuclease/phosphatase family protein [Microbacterium sp.]MCV0422058.1 endonuclease/exonuclease/phosphatase family protein [Microbacterium sp.]